ncbi:type II toxin-antitoxin system death-on-curing family toxin [Erwinia aphidicola]|uniref:type II toxin-antitoxin system death-on-curing family toxin n=1 Tax=Erwinia aphidicola TaxID=68334 RepID=UPI0030D52124
MTIRFISAEEVIAFHDRIMNVTPGVKGMPDPGRAQALIHRVLNQHISEDVDDIFKLAAIHLLAISRGQIFNDGNKRTALFTTLLFLRRNGIEIPGNEAMVDLTVEVAKGNVSVESIVNFLNLFI